jgi:hypothetical protein
MTPAETAILNAIKYLRTQPDCKTAADLLMAKFRTEKMMMENVRVTAVKRVRC